MSFYCGADPGVCRVGVFSSQQPKERACEGVDVGASVQSCCPGDDFGRAVGQGGTHGPAVISAAVGGQGGTEVGEHDAVETARLPELLEALREGRSVLRILGVQMDFQNLSWVYRSLRYYDLTPEERVARLLPCRYRLGSAALRRMARAEDLGTFWAALKASPYGPCFEDSPPTEEMAMERDMRRAIRKTAMEVFRQGMPDLSTMMAVLTLLESEVQDLITLIEDVRYDYDRRHAALFLARPLIPGGEVRWQW